MKIGDKEIEDTHLFAIISVVGSACAYLFQFGFATANGIPNYLVQLGISQFVLTAVTGLAFLWLIYGYFLLAAKSIASNDRLTGAFGVMLFASTPIIFTDLTQRSYYLYSNYLDFRYFSVVINGLSVIMIFLVIASFIFPKEIKMFVTLGILDKK